MRKYIFNLDHPCNKDINTNKKYTLEKYYGNGVWQRYGKRYVTKYDATQALKDYIITELFYYRLWKKHGWSIDEDIHLSSEFRLAKVEYKHFGNQKSIYDYE